MNSRTPIQQHEQAHKEWMAFRGQPTTPETIQRMMTHDCWRSKIDAIRSGFLTQEQFQILADDENPEVRAEAICGIKKITRDQIAKALADTSAKVRCAALTFDVTPAQAKEAFKDPQTRYEAIQTGKLSQAQLNKAVGDACPLVRQAATEAGGRASLMGVWRNLSYRAKCIF